MTRRRTPLMPGMPPGMMPPGVAPIGMMPPPGAEQQQQQDPKAAILRSKNPFPAGKESMKILRAISDCPITREADNFNDLTKAVVTMEDNEELLETLGKGITTILNADNYCEKALKARTVVLFEEDDQLQKIQKEMDELDAELQTLQKEVSEKAMRMRDLLRLRWQTAVKNYALSDDARAYRINEEHGRIEQVDLHCQECKGGTKIRKIRQELNEQLFKHGAGRHAGPDDTGTPSVSEEEDGHGGGEKT